MISTGCGDKVERRVEQVRLRCVGHGNSLDSGAASDKVQGKTRDHLHHQSEQLSSIV